MLGYAQMPHSGRRLRRRRVAAAGLASMAVLVVLPLAVAWACVPGAAIGFDRPGYQYRAGETVTVIGRAFARHTQVTLELTSPSGATTPIGNGVMTDGSGNFDDSFALPASAAPGAYLVLAKANTTDVNGHGATYEARETFRVLAPVAAVQPPALKRPLPAPAVGMVFKGTGASDTIVGTPFADVLTCGGGNDVVRAGGGNDVIDCGAGRDRVDAGAGDDRVTGAAGNDKIAGGAGNDRISGGSGADNLKGGSGNDTLRGNTGKDRLSGGAGRDVIFRGASDVLSGGSGKDRMVG